MCLSWQRLTLYFFEQGLNQVKYLVAKQPRHVITLGDELNNLHRLLHAPPPPFHHHQPQMVLQEVVISMEIDGEQVDVAVEVERPEPEVEVVVVQQPPEEKEKKVLALLDWDDSLFPTTDVFNAGWQTLEDLSPRELRLAEVGVEAMHGAGRGVGGRRAGRATDLYLLLLLLP